MKKALKYNIERVFDENKGKLLISITSIITGVIIGAIWAYVCKGTQSFDDFISSYKLLGISDTDILRRAIFANTRTVLLIWISGWFIFLLPINYIELLSKGFGLGYTVSFIVIQDEIKGFLISISSLFLQNAILIPAIAIYSVVQLKFAISFYNIKRSATLYRQRRRLIANNIITLFIMILICVLCSFIDAYITPFLLKAFI